MKKSDSRFQISVDEHSSPVLVLEPGTLKDFRAAKTSDESDNGETLRLAGAAVRILSQGGASLAARGLYRVIADPKVGFQMLTKVKGSPDLYRGFFREGGKITGHAKLKPVNLASVAMFAVALLEVATVITSTVHLQEIGKQLKKVKELVQKLHDLIDDQRIGKLMGNLEYLYEVWNVLEHGMLSSNDTERYSQQLEMIYRDCLSEIHTAKLQIDRRKSEIDKAEKIRINGKLFWKKISRKDTDDLEDCVAAFSASLHISLLSQEVAVIACSVGSKLGLPSVQSSHRISNLNQHITVLKADWDEYGDHLRTKFEDVSSRPEARKIQQKLAALVQQHRERPKTLINSLKEVKPQLESSSQLEMYVKIEEGEVVEARRVGKSIL